jgi:uncharacterized protein with HEPN domain
MTRHDDVVRLRHMQDYARKAVEFTKNKSRSDLDADQMLALATVHCIEIVGEAVHSLSDELKELHPEIPWNLISGTRNRLIHGYADVNLDVIWAIVKRDLPLLIDNLGRLINGDAQG